MKLSPTEKFKGKKICFIGIVGKFLLMALGITGLVQIGVTQSPTPTPAKKDCVNDGNIKLQGFRSGMDVGDILRALRMPRSKVKSVETEAIGPDGKKYGEKIGWTELEYVDTENRFPGVFLLKFGFFDGTLIDMLIGYDGSIAWSSVSEFAFSVGKSLSLPNSGWVFDKVESPPGRDADRAVFDLCEGRLIALLGKHDSIEKHLGKDINPLTGNPMNDRQVVVLTNDLMHSLLEDEVLELVKMRAEDKAHKNQEKKKVFKP